MPLSATSPSHASKKQKLYTEAAAEGQPGRTLGAPRFHQAPGGYVTAGGMYVA